MMLELKSKTEMKEHIENEPIKPKLLIFYKNQEENNRFGYLPNHRTFVVNADKFKINGNYYVNEIVTMDQPRKPYLDLEMIYPDKETYEKKYKSLMKKLIRDTMKIFDEKYDEKINKEDILLLNSSGEIGGKYKISFHVIVSPKDKTYYYTNSKYTSSSAYHFYTSLIELDENYKEMLDGSVYNEELNFRIIESAKKPDDKRILVPYDSINIKKIDIKLSDKVQYFLTHINKKCIELKTPIIQKIQNQQIQKIQNKKIINIREPSYTDMKNEILILVRKYHPSAEYSGSPKDMYYNFNYIDRKEKCPLTGNIHSGTNGFYVKETERGYYMYCHSNNCKGKYKHIGYPDGVSNLLDDAHQINQKYLSENNNDAKIVEQKYLLTNGIDGTDIVAKTTSTWLKNDKFKILAIKSPMGTGKTTFVTQIMDAAKNNGEFKTILWITHRKSLTNQLIGSFEKYGFKNYMDNEGVLFQFDRIIVQLDSLMRIQKHVDGNYLIKNYELVIIDESERN